MTIDEALTKMKYLARINHDPEVDHSTADYILCELVKSAYGEKGEELVQLFHDLTKWYA
jgi:hypothetical protein